MGGYFGARLAHAGHDVHFIARGDHLAAMQRNGLRVDSILGDVVIAPANATSDPEQVGVVDFVIVAVKGWQLADAARGMRPLIGSNTAVLPLLNGIEASDILADALGRGHVLGGLCRILAEMVGPGHIRHSAMEPSIILGELDNRRSERVKRLNEALVHAGVRTDIADDIHVALWEKFMLIAAWSGVGAVTRVPIGVWRSLPATRAMIEAALREIVALAHARGILLPESRVTSTLEFIDAVPYGGIASMQRDVMEGRPSELESQNGAVVRLGAEAGVPTPTHSFLYHALLPQERTARG